MKPCIFWTKQVRKSQILGSQQFSSNSPYCLYHFWNCHILYEFCITHSWVLWHITPMYFLGQTLHTLDKKSPSNYSLSDFWVLWWKFTKFVMPFLKTQVSLYSNFAWLISIMKYNSCVFFSSNLAYFGQKETMEVQILRLFKWQEKLRILNWALKILQIFTFWVTFQLSMPGLS